MTRTVRLQYVSENSGAAARTAPSEALPVPCAAPRSRTVNPRSAHCPRRGPAPDVVARSGALALAKHRFLKKCYNPHRRLSHFRCR